MPLPGCCRKVVLAAIIAPTLAPAEAAAFAGYPEEQAYSLAMHMHGSMSEMYGSMEWHTAKAESLGVDVIWWTDHDWRLNNVRAMKKFNFENSTWSVAQSRWEEPDEAWSANVRYWDTDLSAMAVVTTSIADALAYEGSHSLRMEAASQPGAQFASGYLEQTTMMFTSRYSLAKRVVLSFALYPELLDAQDARFVLEVELSDHPDGGKILRYVAGTMDGEGAHSTSLAYTPGMWNTYTIDVTAAAIQHFSTGGADTLRAEDNSLCMVRIGLETRNASPATVFFDDYRIAADPAVVGDALLDRARSIAGYYETLYPGVGHYAGTEISHFLAQPHLNGFAPNLQLVDYAGHDWPDSIYYAIDQIHAQGGAVSLNHIYGPRFDYQYDPYETPTEQAGRHLWTKKTQIAIRAYGVDILEVGYRRRGGMDLAQHLDLWDALNANAIWMTGNGVSDSHGRGEHDLIGWGPATAGLSTVNNFVTWFHTEQRSEAGFVQAMKRGRAYFGDPYLWQGSLDMRTLTGFRMGQVVFTDRTTDDLVIEVTNVPVDAQVRLLQAEIRENPPTSYATANYLRDEILGGAVTAGTFTDTVSVDVTLPSFFRIEVANGTGEGLVYGNPICFVRSVPQNGIPPARVAALLQDVRAILAGAFTLRGAAFESAGVLTLTGDEEPAGSGVIVLDPGGLGPPVWTAGAANSTYSGGVLTVSGFSGTGSVVQLGWTPTGALEPLPGPSSLRLSSGRPNPFGEGTIFDYALPRAGHVQCEIHDVAGRRVRVLESDVREAGPHQAGWDGRDAAGRSVAAGVYYLRLTFGDESVSRTVVKIRR